MTSLSLAAPIRHWQDNGLWSVKRSGTASVFVDCPDPPHGGVLDIRKRIGDSLDIISVTV
jgi:hypothetical protein